MACVISMCIQNNGFQITLDNKKKKTFCEMSWIFIYLFLTDLYFWKADPENDINFYVSGQVFVRGRLLFSLIKIFFFIIGGYFFPL